VRPEALGQKIKSRASPENEPKTLQLLMQGLDQLHHRESYDFFNVSYNVKTLVDKLSNHTEVLKIKFKNSAALCSNRATSLPKCEGPLNPAFP